MATNILQTHQVSITFHLHLLNVSNCIAYTYVSSNIWIKHHAFFIKYSYVHLHFLVLYMTFGLLLVITLIKIYKLIMGAFRTTRWIYPLNVNGIFIFVIIFKSYRACMYCNIKSKTKIFIIYWYHTWFKNMYWRHFTRLKNHVIMSCVIKTTNQRGNSQFTGLWLSPTTHI